MQQAQVLHVAVVEEADDLVDVVDRLAAGRADDGLARGGHRLQQRPVERAAARDLQDVDLVLEAQLDRRLVERRDHAQHPRVPRGGDETVEVARREARRLEPADVLDVAAAGVLGVDERVEVAVLQLHRGLDAVAARDAAHLRDDAEAVLDVALVVVRHLEHEQQVRERVGHAVFLPFSVPADASQAMERRGRDHAVVDVVVRGGLAEAELVVADAPALQLRERQLGPLAAGGAAAGGVDHDAVARAVERVDRGDTRGQRLRARVLVAGHEAGDHAVQVEREGQAGRRSVVGWREVEPRQLGPLVDVGQAAP